MKRATETVKTLAPKAGVARVKTEGVLARVKVRVAQASAVVDKLG